MDRAEILKQVNQIFIDVLDDEKIVLKGETVAKDVEAWDSLSHIQLISAIEKHFKIQFTTSQILAFRDVGHICDEIQKKIVSL